MSSVYQFWLKYTCFLAASRLFANTMPMKRPAGVAWEGRAAKRPAVRAGDIDDAMIKGRSGRDRMDRNKKGYFDSRRHFLPDGVGEMVDGMACHQRGQYLNILVQGDVESGYRFNLSHPVVQDFLCATVV